MSDMLTLAKRLADACPESYRFFMAPEYGPDNWGVTDIASEDVLWDNAAPGEWWALFGPLYEDLPYFSLEIKPSLSRLEWIAEQVVTHFETLNSSHGRPEGSDSEEVQDSGRGDNP